ncbi:putative PurR-regulated permease PerM [Pontibacter ummariensis]|uniref:Predicted PurR-regulated permease PerM n=1 Tax=Pontibacter ummariensis TaxID=1610492 RepID=A0A239ETP7_9BACT|nr:AI-2E family transporter [Pontibacter ummariensis]PRY12776.1 putative PurR-regulated permease PerM [Pontibacter ummariensis]SNS47413.1 Predicted PurR-regulated permease PerM [Pontibacter ummariensis]
MNVYLYAKRAAIATFVLLLLTVGFFLIGKYFYFVLLVFSGALLAILLCGITNWIVHKTHLNRGLSLFLAFILFFGAITGAFWLIAPTVSDQFRQLSASVPQSLNKVQEWLNQYGWGSQLLQKVPENVSVSNLIPDQGASAGQETFVTKVINFLSSLFGVLFDLLIVTVTALYFAANPKLYTHGFASLFPVRNQDRVLEVLDKLYLAMKKWLWSMLIIMALVGVSTAVAYQIIGLPLAYALALLAFMLQFIPNIGPLIAAVPAVLIGLTVSPQTAVTVGAVFALIQVVEGLVILPLVLKRAIKIPPALLLFFQVLLGVMQGALGVLLAAPLLAVLLVVTRELWVRDVIHAKQAKAREPVPLG